MSVPRGAAARRLGYVWENALVRRIRAVDGWDAVRVGSPSAEMPDIVAWTAAAERPSALVVECKARSTAKPCVVDAPHLAALHRWAMGPLLGRRAEKLVACRWTARGRAAVERFVFVPKMCTYGGAGLSVSADGPARGVKSWPEGAPATSVTWQLALAWLVAHNGQPPSSASLGSGGGPDRAPGPRGRKPRAGVAVSRPAPAPQKPRRGA